ncbi:Acyltransferase 3 [Cryptosporidium felis]|nr:Acyltransferase 3 [Cryptosporidium felis]
MDNIANSRGKLPNEMKKLSSPRLHYLDWLKTLAVWLVIFVHVIYYLNLLNIGITTNEKNVVKQMIVFFSEFGMPIFFYVSGRATFLSSVSSFKTLLKKKVLRLALPLASGYFILLPITHYVANGRRPCSYTLNGNSVNFNTYYLMYIKDFTCHGFEWLWFLALLIVTSVVMFPFLKVMKDQNKNENILCIVMCGLISAGFGPLIIYSYDFHPLALFGLSFPLMVMLVSSLVMRSSKSKKANLDVVLIYLTAASFILGSLFLAFYSNVDYSPKKNPEDSDTNWLSEDQKAIFPKKGFMRSIDDRRMMLAIIFYISFYAVGFIDQLLSHHCSSNETAPENQALIEENSLPFAADSTSGTQLNAQNTGYSFNTPIRKETYSNTTHSIINNMPGMLKPTLVFISLILYSISFSLGENGIGYMWAFPMYRIPSSSVLYVAGSWIVVFVLDSVCHSLLNQVFVPKLYFHFTASSIILYIVHMLWIEFAITYIIIPLQIPYIQSVFLTFIFTILLSILTYFLAIKVKFIGLIIGLTTSFTSKPRNPQTLQVQTKDQHICV